MDVERSELEVFSHADLGWLSKIRLMAIELHDAKCHAAYQEALSRIPHRTRAAGEVTMTEFLTPALAPAVRKAA
jgi:hypothetical protein